jgi:hypothetical protein
MSQRDVGWIAELQADVLLALLDKICDQISDAMFVHFLSCSDERG